MIDFDNYKCPECGGILFDHLNKMGLRGDCGHPVMEDDLRKGGQIK